MAYCDSTTTFNNYISDYLSQNSTTACSNIGNYMFQNSTTTYSDIDNYTNFDATTGVSSISTAHINMCKNIVHDYRCGVTDVFTRELSEEELSRLRAERIEAEENAKRIRKETEEAKKKARLLLLECLDEDNSKRLINGEHLEVQSRLFKDIKYHIPISNGRIKALKGDNIVSELCVSIRETSYFPTDDIVLTKLLYTLYDEENMIRKANHFNVSENLLAMLN